ncbi:MAG: hypothetical protein Q4F15_03955 [Bacillota bacterium]|nr:hypothetical protein [Bacillota bacterium]
MNDIIIYYSRTGTCKKLAEKIQKDLDCPIESIELKEGYGNYLSSLLRYQREKKKAIEPEFSTPFLDLESYERVILVYPIFFGDIPEFVTYYLERCAYKEIELIPVSNSTATSNEKSLATLRERLPKAKISHPYWQSKFHKGDFPSWIWRVKAGMPEEE